MSTRRMSAQERREQLLDVTADVLLADGVSTVTIDRVARDAEIARTVVYSHFDNLEGLLHALQERTERRVLDQVRSLVPDTLGVEGNPDDFLVDGLRGFLELVQADPRLWRLAVLPPEGAPPALRARIKAGKTTVLNLLVPVIAWGINARGGPEGVDPELFARFLVSAAEDAARLTLQRPDEYPPERLAGFAAALLAAMRPPA